MLAGLIRDDERKVRDGIPGLSDIPGIGHLLGHSSNERNQTDVIVMLTPRIVRVLELTEDDLRAFQMGRDASSTGAAPAAVSAGRRRHRCFHCRMSRRSRPRPTPRSRRRRAAAGRTATGQAGASAGATAADAARTPGRRRRRVRHASGSASDRGACLRSRHTCGYRRPERPLHVRTARSRVGDRGHAASRRPRRPERGSRRLSRHARIRVGRRTVGHLARRRHRRAPPDVASARGARLSCSRFGAIDR